MPEASEGCLSLRFSPRNLLRERFPIGPDRSILKVFLLPDGDFTLECVDEPAASFKSSRAVCRCYRNQHTGLTNLQSPKPVNDGDMANFKILHGGDGQRLHLLDGHLFVSFVIQVERLAPSGLVAYCALEYQRGAIISTLQSVH